MPSPRSSPASLSVDRPDPPFGVIVFDCDSTLSFIEGIEELKAGLGPDEVSAIADLTALAMDGQAPLEEVYGRRLKIIRPSKDDVEGVARLYLATVLAGVEDTIHALRYLGKELAVVSGGLAPPVQALAKYLGIPDERVWAVGIEFDSEGQYAGFDEGSPLARKGGKADVISAAFPDASVALVGDGATDAEAKMVCDRFVAFTGVVERPDVVRQGDRVCRAADFAALLPHLCSESELDQLAASGSERFAELAERARRPRLWIPGPTEVRPELLATQSAPMVGHRTDAMRELMRAIDPHLRVAFGLEGAPFFDVGVHSCTATALMEMSLRALPDPNGEPPRVLSLVNGSFSRRYAEIAESLGCAVTRIESELGAPADLEAAARALAGDGPFAAITVCLSETSTGALTDPSEIASALAARGGAWLLVDAVTYFAAAPLDAARHGMDFCFAGTQKALALPPGLGIYCVSRRMLEGARSTDGRGFFLDLVRVTEGHAAQNPPMTPTIPLFRALLSQLRTIAEGAREASLIGEPTRGRSGWELRFARHAKLRSIGSEWLGREGLHRPGKQDHVTASPTVICLEVGEGRVPGILDDMRSAGFEIAPGYGPLRGSHVRIGHMGDHSVQEFRALLATLSTIL